MTISTPSGVGQRAAGQAGAGAAGDERHARLGAGPRPPRRPARRCSGSTTSAGRDLVVGQAVALVGAQPLVVVMTASVAERGLQDAGQLARAAGVPATGWSAACVSASRRAARVTVMAALVRRQGEELGELVGQRHLREQRPRVARTARCRRELADLLAGDPRRLAPRRPARRSRAVAVGSLTPLCSHCQTWEREISAVAASSIRLLMATAPLPAQPRLEVLDADADVAAQARLGDRRPASTATSSSCSARDVHVLALLVELVGPVAEDRVEDLRGRSAPGPGAPPRSRRSRRSASRALSARTLRQRRLVDLRVLRLGMNAAMPPMACAPRLWQVRTSSSV